MAVRCAFDFDAIDFVRNRLNGYKYLYQFLHLYVKISVECSLWNISNEELLLQFTLLLCRAFYKKVIKTNLALHQLLIM